MPFSSSCFVSSLFHPRALWAPKGGSNALMNASACNQVDVVKLLLEANAGKDARDVVCVRHRRNFRMLDCWCKFSPWRFPCLLPCRHFSPSARCADVTLRHTYVQHGATALIYAAYHGHILVAEALVQAGANINIVTYKVSLHA